ncbi:MAG TPA: class I SAM-dependent methyltransferase [Alloacidobacterium sp.]|jgi:SAM-dependent methyltransferase|nr:class I SAM-dependent methyltransferase [Alloacidobacterium sp.]
MSTVAQGANLGSIDGVELQCPRCGRSLEPSLQVPGFICNLCNFPLLLRDGIWRALPEERAAYFSQFIHDYEMIRAAEGRGSHTADYYLGLPYKDASGRNSTQWKIRARTFDYMSKHLLPKLPDKARVLDIGAGNGWMSYRLSWLGFRAIAVDLLVNDQDGLGAATHYQSRLPDLFPRVQAESSKLPFTSGQFDAVIFNASFHYAESYTTTLYEAMRCLKDGGMVIIADTPWYSSRASGERMLAERRISFLQRFGTPSDSITSLEYLTDTQLIELEQAFGIRWEQHIPFYGVRWAMRPIRARLRGRREPARFRIYTARKVA